MRPSRSRATSIVGRAKNARVQMRRPAQASKLREPALQDRSALRGARRLRWTSTTCSGALATNASLPSWARPGPAPPRPRRSPCAAGPARRRDRPAGQRQHRDDIAGDDGERPWLAFGCAVADDNWSSAIRASEAQLAPRCSRMRQLCGPAKISAAIQRPARRPLRRGRCGSRARVSISAPKSSSAASSRAAGLRPGGDHHALADVRQLLPERLGHERHERVQQPHGSAPARRRAFGRPPAAPRRCHAAGPWPPRCTSRRAPTRRTREAGDPPRHTDAPAASESPRR